MKKWPREETGNRPHLFLKGHSGDAKLLQIQVDFCPFFVYVSHVILAIFHLFVAIGFPLTTRSMDLNIMFTAKVLLK